MEDIDKIPFYKERTIGERMTAAIDFARENWPFMLRSAIYVLLPLSIVQSVAMNSFFGDYLGFTAGLDQIDDPDSSTGIILRVASSYAILLLCLLLGGILLQALTFTMIKEYNEREEGLEGITFGMIWNHLWINIKRVTKASLACVGAVIVLLLLSLLNPLALILFIPALLVFSIPMLLFPCIYSFERLNIRDAAAKALRLGFGTWAGLFVINMVFGFIMNIISQAVSIPWGICAVLSMIFTEYEDVPPTLDVIVHVLSFLFGVVMMFVTYLATMLQPLSTAYHYAHATERKDSITMDADIDNFENLE